MGIESDSDMYLSKIWKRLGRMKELIHHPRAPIADIELYQTHERPDVKTAAKAKGYKEVALGDEWGERWITGWFRFRAKAPKEFAGRAVAALIETQGESLAFVGGEPVQGLDRNRNDLLLTDKAKAGEKFEVLVESVAMSAFGKYGERPKLARAELAVYNTELEALYYDGLVLWDIADRLTDESRRRGEIIRALDSAVEVFGVRETGPDGMAALALAAREVLRPHLESPAGPSSGEVFACGHAHIDVAWLWPLWETHRKVGRTFSTALHYMDRYPDYHFTQSQQQLYEFCREDYPSLYARLKEKVASGQWDPSGAMWVEADCNIPSGESLVRQLVHGRRYFREDLGTDTDILWLPDVFGYAAALPGILRHCGVKYFLTTKIDWNQINEFPHDTFRWFGIDGSEVLAHFPPAKTYNGTMRVQQIHTTERGFAQKDRSPGAVYPFGFGDGGGGPTREMIERAVRMKNIDGVARVTMCGADEFFRRAEAESEDLPVWRGELYLELHRGTYTTQARTKRDNRRSEEALFEAEMLAAAAAELGAEYPAGELHRAWRLVLLNQFHDVIPGSSIKEVYQDNAAHYDEVREKTAAVRSAALGALAEAVDTSAGPADTACLVTNALPWERGGLVELAAGELPEGQHLHDETGRPLRVQVLDSGATLVQAPPVPSCGWRTLQLLEKPPHQDPGPGIEASTGHLANRLIDVVLDDRGEIASVTDLRSGREVVPEGERANVIELFEDKPNNWDAWDIDRWYYDNPPMACELVSAELVESGPLRATVRQVRKVGEASELVQEISVSAASPVIEFRTRVDWNESERMLKVAFPVEVLSPEAAFEVQYGLVRRPTHRNTSWDKARFEVAAQRWIDLAEPGYGVALMNDCKYGHDVVGSRMRITLLRAPTSPDETADRGRHEFTYALMPHAGDHREGGVLRAAGALNVPLRADMVGSSAGPLPPEGSIARVDSPDIVISAVKRADDSDRLVVRLYEAHGSRGSASLQCFRAVARAWESNGMEEEVAELDVEAGALTFDYAPFGIRTFLVELES